MPRSRDESARAARDSRLAGGRAAKTGTGTWRGAGPNPRRPAHRRDGVLAVREERKMMRERMTPKERVLAALAHREPDRVPINYLANAGDAHTA